MSVIYKYELKLTNTGQEIRLPDFWLARVEHAPLHPDNPGVLMWVVISRVPNHDDPKHNFRVIGTGMPWNGETWEWVGSTPPQDSTGLVWHVLRRFETE